MTEFAPMLDAMWPWLLWGSVAFSVLALLSTFVGLPWILTRLPEDYLVGVQEPVVWGPMRILQNAGGWVLIGLGVLMLVLPGQGILTILAGLILVDLPGKRRWIRTLLRQGPVNRAVSALRSRAGVAPLLL